MSKKKSEPQASDFIKHNSEELLAELVEISEEDLQQIVGGDNFWDGIRGGITTKVDAIITLIEGTPTTQTVVDVATPTHWHIIRRWLR
jgi:bacteriocin-like protein